MPTMISTAFPKEAFKRPESVWPSLSESWSVATPNSYTIQIKSRSTTKSTRTKPGMELRITLPWQGA